MLLQTASAQYPGWQHSGSLYILTTPEGANLPATASEENFPLLVRLNKGLSISARRKPNGEDIRFSSATGKPLAYQIEEWDAAEGTASIWVRIPLIKGNARQEIKLHWGKADAASESKGLGRVQRVERIPQRHAPEIDPVKDEVGTLAPTDAGTTASAGMIGQGRHFDAGKGINCGEKITAFPTGASPHSSEAWFRAERPNAPSSGWGNEQGRAK